MRDHVLFGGKPFVFSRPLESFIVENVLFKISFGMTSISATIPYIAGSLVGPRLALAGGAVIVLVYVWLSLVRATALRNLVLAPKPG